MIQVINRALDILEFVSVEPEKPKLLSDISTALDLNAGTCANIIKTLVTRKYLEQSAKRKGYILGSKAFKLTGNEGYKKDLVTSARKEMNLLVQKFNENTLLAVLDKDIRSVILRVDGNQDLQANTQSEKKAYNSSAGRLLLSSESEEWLKKFTELYGLPTKDQWAGVKNYKGLLENLHQIKADGFSIQIAGNQIVGIAAPIGYEGKMIAALSMYMPLYRFDSSKQGHIIEMLKGAAKRISEKL